MRNFKKFRKIKFIILFAVFYLLFVKSSIAQTPPEFLITWRSDNYVPPGYLGKALPIKKSRLTAAFELTDKNKIVDLSRREIRWFINDNLYKSGIGLKNISFQIPQFSSNELFLKVAVINYNSQNFEKEIRIPVASPETVIDAPYPERKISGQVAFFRVLPYFFNIGKLTDLSFSWEANGFKTQGKDVQPDFLELAIAGGQSGTRINLSVKASNNSDALEFSGQTINLEIK